ncbi:MAG: UvrD-helicase domain-containing protein, partial [Chloroflexi bacterium]|nr:UvrD-helicase domain-containing protein [Chloroflexota bacterium]
MESLAHLNPQQQQAVMAGLGPALVLAGPGSGKTRVLTQRIAYLVGAMGVRPYQILAVTFTNKAAREMEARVQALLGDQMGPAAGQPLLGTFHAVCARILRREAEHLPIQSNFVIFDADDQVALVKEATRDLNLDEKLYRPLSVHGSISNAKNELILPEDYPVQTYRDEVVGRIYRRYQELLLLNNAVDFDDLLLWTAYLLETQPAVRERYARRFEHVLVDEFQDTNLAQYTLLKHLVSFHRNLYVVGDADQSIYGWRGADYRNVLRFQKDFPDAQVILLEQNYRSTQNILDLAMAVIERNPQRIPRKLFTQRGAGQRAVMYEAYDDRAEASYVVDTIVSLSARQQARPGDFAVMYRTNAQSRVLEEAFLHAGLPYRLVGAQRFYGRREIKDTIAYLRLVHNPSDEISLTRIVNVPARGIGVKGVAAMRTQAQQAGLSMGDWLLAQDETGKAGGRGSGSLAHFARLLADWRVFAAGAAPLSLMDRVLNDVEYQAYLEDGTEEGRERWENVMELRRLAAEFREQGLEAFLERVALVSDQDTLDERGSAATLLTLHAAKGLEFPIVFIVGLNDGTLPHSRSFDDPEAMQEERRLFYVGVTRAKDRLHLSYSQNRSLYGYAEPVEPSRYLADIPGSLLDSAQPPRSRRSSTREAGYRGETWGSTAAASRAPVQPRFHAGARVIHKV